MQNLRDKLMKAGLVTEEQIRAAEAERVAKAEAEKQARANTASSEPRREAPQRDAFRGGARAAMPTGNHPPPRRSFESNRPRAPSGPARTPAYEAPIPKLPPLPGSKAHQRIESQKQRELADKLRSLVQSGQVELELGDHAFHFVTRKGRLRRMQLSEAQAKMLEEGKLAVVERQEPAQIEHSLVSPETAAQMFVLLEKSVRFFNRDGAPVGFISDDELKDRQVAESTAGPEVPEPAAEAVETGAEEGESSSSAGESDTWIAIKRAPVSGG